MSLDAVLKQIEGIDSKIVAFDEKYAGEVKDAKTASVETKNAIEKLGQEQKEMAERLLEMEQKGVKQKTETNIVSIGRQFIESNAYKNFNEGSTQKARVEVMNNTITGSDATVAPDRKPGVVPGAFEPMTLEQFLPSLPTSSNAIEFTKEASFTNSAAETAEAAEKPESALTFSLVSMPVSTVAHWVKISEQLAADAPALRAYIDTRMRYGVDRRVETQLGAGNGTSPNISGLLDTGNFTAHGYLSGALGSTLPKLVLIRKMIADCWANGYPADAILVNPADWATIEIELMTTAANQARVSTNAMGTAMLFGLPVVQSIGITADTLLVGAFRQSCTVHNRQGMMVDMSNSDDDNFTKNLITIRAERRLALTVERPAAILGGDLTPPAS